MNGGKRESTQKARVIDKEGLKFPCTHFIQIRIIQSNKPLPENSLVAFFLGALEFMIYLLLVFKITFEGILSDHLRLAFVFLMWK